MATKRITEVVFITAQEIVGALQLLGYPISGSEKVEVKWRKPGGGDFDGLTFTTAYDSTVRRSEPPTPQERDLRSARRNGAQRDASGAAAFSYHRGAQ